MCGMRPPMAKSKRCDTDLMSLAQVSQPKVARLMASDSSIAENSSEAAHAAVTHLTNTRSKRLASANLSPIRPVSDISALKTASGKNRLSV